jgi:hypothetical protein
LWCAATRSSGKITDLILVVAGHKQGPGSADGNAVVRSPQSIDVDFGVGHHIIAIKARDVGRRVPRSLSAISGPMRVDPLLPRAEKLTLVLEAIGDDRQSPAESSRKEAQADHK